MSLLERILVTVLAVTALGLAAAVVKKEFFPARAEVSFIELGVWGADSPWWSPRYNGYGPNNAGDRWTFGGAHSYTTRQLMGQRI